MHQTHSPKTKTQVQRRACFLTALALSATVSLLFSTAPVLADHHEPAQDFAKALPAEPIPAVTSLQTPYPASYAVVHDFAFGSLTASSFALVDTETRAFKGMVSAGNFATIDLSMQRQELYVGENYYSRGNRGERTDLVTIYDMANLDIVAEIELPKKRAAIVVNKGSTAITASNRFMLVFNFEPGTSVSVVDLEKRAFVGEIAAPGCGMVYPSREHDFFMLCGDGTLMAVDLDDQGVEVSRQRSEAFIDIDADPLSEKASRVGERWHFVSFLGDVQPLDMATKTPTIEQRWSLTSKAERADNWRPAGWHWTAAHPDQRLWVGMTPNGYPGSHKDPAPEVWLFDTDKQQRLQRFKLKTPALSIDVTLEQSPRLLVVNAEGALDVYDAHSGEYLRSIYDLGASPYQVHRMQ